MKIQNLIDNTQNYSPFSFPNQLASFLFMGITKSHKKGNIYEICTKKSSRRYVRC
mgnify:CR=1 FL=1